MYVVNMPSPNLHVVLGQSWLKSHNAAISYADKCVLFWPGGWRSVLKNVCVMMPLCCHCHLHCHLIH